MEFKGAIPVGVIGKTNAGKSSLVNSLVGEKVSIVTPKKQTTRENILGILNLDDCQIIFVDTPGIHKTVDNLGKLMMKQVRSVKDSVDLVLYVVDGSKPFDEQEYSNIKKMSESNSLILILSKTDIAGFEKIYPLIDKFNKLSSIEEIIPVSSKTNKNLDLLIEKIKQRLIEVDCKDLYYDRETYTDKSVRFMCAEIVREKILLNLNQEIPYGVMVDVIRFEESDNLVEIDIDITTNKPSHKSIIIGKQASMLKKISTQAREDMEKLLYKKVMLKIYVAIR